MWAGDPVPPAIVGFSSAGAQATHHPGCRHVVSAGRLPVNPEPTLGPASSPPLPSQALLKMDCQGLVVRLIQDFVLLTTAVEVAQRWRELAEKLAKVSKQQMDAYESPHRDRNGVVDSEVSPAPLPSACQLRW